MNKERFLLAFDPSLNRTGYAVLDCKNKVPKIAEMGAIKGRSTSWSTNTPHQVKLALIQSKTKELRAKYHPIYPHVFLERGFSKFNNSTQATFRARGALESELVGVEIVEYPPSEIKKCVSDDGGGSKESVAEALATIFGISVDDFETDDVSDALATAYTGYKKHYMKGN